MQLHALSGVVVPPLQPPLNRLNWILYEGLAYYHLMPIMHALCMLHQQLGGPTSLRVLGRIEDASSI